MTTEREYQEWRNKRQKSSYKYKIPQNNPVFLWLLGLLALSAMISLKAYHPTDHSVPASSPPSSSINEQAI